MIIRRRTSTHHIIVLTHPPTKFHTEIKLDAKARCPRITAVQISRSPFNINLVEIPATYLRNTAM